MKRTVLFRLLNSLTPFRSGSYWERRYKTGFDSGSGSYGDLAAFKADVINAFVLKNEIKRAIEFGCGDGNQLSLLNIPDYIGIDVSEEAVKRCAARFENDPRKKFLTLTAYTGDSAELSLSLDVLYHLVEDEIYNSYMDRLFTASTKYVIIYSSNTNCLKGYISKAHVRHREFTTTIRARYPRFEQIGKVANPFPWAPDRPTGSFADFFLFEKH